MWGFRLVRVIPMALIAPVAVGVFLPPVGHCQVRLPRHPVPQIRRPVPQLPGTVPQMTRPIPQMRGTVPQMTGTVPLGNRSVVRVHRVRHHHRYARHRRRRRY